MEALLWIATDFDVNYQDQVSDSLVNTTLSIVASFDFSFHAISKCAACVPPNAILFLNCTYFRLMTVTEQLSCGLLTAVAQRW